MLRYSFLMRDFTQTAVIAAIALVLLVTAAAFLSRQSTLPAAMPTPSVTPAVTLQEYSMNGTKLAFSQQADRSKGGFREVLNVSNEGNATIELGLIDVIPNSLSPDAAFANPFPEISRSPALAEVLNLNPLIRMVGLALAPRQLFSAAFSSSASAGAPVHLLANPRMNADEKKRLLPLLKKIADLDLSEGEAREVQKKINDAFVKALAQNNSFEEFLNAVGDFVEGVKNAKNARLANPNYNYSVEKLSVDLPKPLSREELLEAFPKLPETIELTASEKDAYAEKEITFEPKLPLGSVLVKFEGDVAKYASAKAEQTARNKYRILISTDLNDVELKNCLFPFDELSGRLVIAFTSLPNEIKSTPITVKIEHVDICKDVKENTLAEAEGDTPEKAVATAEDIQSIGKLTTRYEKTGGTLAWPANGVIIGYWGDARKEGRTHKGIDIRNAKGSPVFAMADGVVEAVNDPSKCGLGIAVRHDGAFAGHRSV
ncbi:M23 family metallopeptidase, partial [Candidatus Micrarchaeota archaeon]|nr:M23 family metallopeptidase [Candidatus Micrarchaeota archaeon]